MDLKINLLKSCVLIKTWLKFWQSFTRGDTKLKPRFVSLELSIFPRMLEYIMIIRESL